jgi:hypothetical protein
MQEDPKYSYKDKHKEDKRPSAMAKGSARVKQYASLRNVTITNSFTKHRRESTLEPNSATAGISRKIKDPSFARPTVNSARKVNQSFDSRRRSHQDYSDETTLNSKYRLISLEKKFENQRIKSKDKLESVSKKMEYL